jgi:hypothetical protein
MIRLALLFVAGLLVAGCGSFPPATAGTAPAHDPGLYYAFMRAWGVDPIRTPFMKSAGNWDSGEGSSGVVVRKSPNSGREYIGMGFLPWPSEGGSLELTPEVIQERVQASHPHLEIVHFRLEREDELTHTTGAKSRVSSGRFDLHDGEQFAWYLTVREHPDDRRSLDLTLVPLDAKGNETPGKP